MGSIIGGQGGDGAGKLDGWIAEGLNQGWFDCGRSFRSVTLRSVPLRYVPFHDMGHRPPSHYTVPYDQVSF